jgi:Bacterial type II/III secretion system short domain
MPLRMKIGLFVLSMGLACGAHAQQTLEIIPLRHATVEQVLPTLRPLLEPGGTLTGQAGQLIVRASPANIAELRTALEAIDRPLRRLQILVRFDDSQDSATQGVETRGTIGNRGSNVDVRVQDARASAEGRVDQRVQVIEGGRAFIATSRSRPVIQRQAIQTPAGPVGQDTFVMQEAVTGFEVVPRISGERVFLDIAPQRERLGAQGSVQGQRVATTASARLGDWFEIGGLVETGAREERGIASGTRSRSAESRRVWVKVEEIRN